MVQGTWSHWYQKTFKRKQNYIRLFGYTSCSLQKSAALQFAWEKPETGHIKVLFHILWDWPYQNYFLDGGAYDYEQEVLLGDGVELKVKSVEEIKQGNETLYTLITLVTY